jgi:hypothetical protein
MSVAHRTVFLALSIAFPAVLFGDTVYLKNGAWIDGRVRARNEKLLEIEIGKIGKIEIPVEEIHEIEKNNRTGEDISAQDRRELERLGLLKDAKKAAPAPAEEKSAETPGEDSSEAQGDGEGKPAAETLGPQVPSDIEPALKERIEQLVADLQRQKPQFRVRAERHLKAIGAPALPFLVPLVKNDSELTRVAVLRIFYEIGDDSVIEACIESLLDPNEYVRDYANKTLERVTKESFGYQSQASPRRRELARDKWRKWWNEEKAEIEKNRALKESARSK